MRIYKKITQSRVVVEDGPILCFFGTYKLRKATNDLI